MLKHKICVDNNSSCARMSRRLQAAFRVVLQVIQSEIRVARGGESVQQLIWRAARDGT